MSLTIREYLWNSCGFQIYIRRLRALHYVFKWSRICCITWKRSNHKMSLKFDSQNIEHVSWNLLNFRDKNFIDLVAFSMSSKILESSSLALDDCFPSFSSSSPFVLMCAYCLHTTSRQLMQMHEAQVKLQSIN